MKNIVLQLTKTLEIINTLDTTKLLAVSILILSVTGLIFSFKI